MLSLPSLPVARKAFYIILLGFTGSPLFSQTGGDHVYDFLDLTHSSLVTSLGGTNVSLLNDDLNMAYLNPALLSSSMDNSLAINYVNYFAGINYGMTMYSKSYAGIGSFAAGITYLNYGTFQETDESGNITGTFTAAEYALSLIYSRTIDSLFSFGVDLKPVLSNLEKYTSFGFAVDAGAAYHSRNGLFSAGLAFKNIGMQITTYTGGARESLPFEIQAGVSQKLGHAPFRFSLTLRHLEKFDLTYNYTSATNPSSTQSFKDGFGENLLRHVIIGAEIIPQKNFYFSAGYNYQRREELQVESKVSTVGFSWGFGINTSFMSIGFGRATYHLAGSSNNISLIIRPDKLYKKLSRV
ncbi:MAG: type IX secretion system protein PorQ [Bacteroidales bacterium]|jgi:hypothetical protein